MGLRQVVRDTGLQIGSLRFETAAAPIFVVHYGPDFCGEDFEALVEVMAQEFPRYGRCAVIHEVGTLRTMLHALTRRRMIQAARRHEALFRKTVAGIAVVSGDGLVRGSVTAIGWLYPTPYPIRCFADVAAARAWVAEILL